MRDRTLETAGRLISCGRIGDEILMALEIAAFLKVSDETVYTTARKGRESRIQGVRPVAIPVGRRQNLNRSLG